MGAPAEQTGEIFSPQIDVISQPFVQFPIEDVETSIPARFQKIVRQFPDRVAVKMGARALTYAALNEYANRIAHAILAQRGTSSEPIALMLEQGIDSIAAILGVLKAGKFYVALDPSTPIERSAYILADCQTPCIIANTRTSSLVREAGRGRAWLNLEEIDLAGASSDPRLTVGAGDFASILYTSGSTGNPKGVVHSHRSQLHTVLVNTQQARIGCEDKLTLLHSIGFGSAQAHIFQSLLNGASLRLFDVNGGISRLAQWLRDEGISVYHSPPTLFRELAAILRNAQKLPELRLIRLSGAALSRADFDLYKEIFCPGALLQVTMNSTEANVISSFIAYESFSFPAIGAPVGYSVEGKEIVLLNEEGNKVAPGESGEIAVNSAYLPPGYWDDFNHDAEHFVADHQRHERRVLTGDIGRFLEDGLLIYLGRKDLMVKVRGFRVEFAEIERALLSHPAVKDAAVAAWDRAPADKYLVGYIVTQRHSAITVSAMRSFLVTRLPDYMVPSNFIFLESLPSTNGKLDRRALPAPDRSRPNLDTPYVGPRNEFEQQLTGLWEEVLNIRPIGVDDNFFDLGGYSLAGARIIAEIHRQHGLELPLRGLFEAPTIARLAASIEVGFNDKRRTAGQDLRYLFSLQAGGDRKPLFFFPGGGGNEPEFFIYARLMRSVGKEYSVFGLRAQGADGCSPPHASVEDMVAAYLEDIRAVQPNGPYYLIGECAGGVTAYEAARQLRDRGEAVALLALLDVERPTLVNYWRYRAREMLRISLIKFHWENLLRLEWKRWPAYLRGEGTGEAASPSAFGPAADLLRARAQAVFEIDGLGKSTPHVETARANYRRVVRRYWPPSYAGPITIIACEKFYRDDPTLGWSGLARNSLRIHVVPGDHDTYLREHVQVTARQLRNCLEQADNITADKASSEKVRAHE